MSGGWREFLAGVWASNGLFLVLALVALAGGLLHMGTGRARVAALAVFASAMAVGVGRWTGSGPLAVCAGAVWLLFPGVHVVVAMRRMRAPKDRRLERVSAAHPRFAPLVAAGREWEKLGFEDVEDAELKPSEPKQVFRFLVSGDRRFLAAVGWVQQGPWTVVYSAVSSWDGAGVHWMTWNYPLPYGLEAAPEMRWWRCPEAGSAEALLRQHIEFLRLNRSEAVPQSRLEGPERVLELWTGWMARQVQHNLARGWLRLAGSGAEVAYSWRGVFGAGRQIVAALFRG